MRKKVMLMLRASLAAYVPLPLYIYYGRPEQCARSGCCWSSIGRAVQLFWCHRSSTTVVAPDQVVPLTCVG